MKGTPLIETGDPTLVMRGVNLALKLVSNVPKVMTVEQLEYHEQHLDGLKDVAGRAFAIPGVVNVDVAPQSRPHIEILHETPKPCVERTADEQIAGMKILYKQLGWTYSIPWLVIPERRKGFDRLIVVGDTTLTNNDAYDACVASFQSWRYKNDLNTAVRSNTDERHPVNGVYAIWLRDRVEADEELKDLSANMIVEKRLKTITLLERQLFELVYFMETGKHLDIQNWTLCSGSRDSDGHVPDARWRGDGFKVFWSYRDNRNPRLRAREAVSL